MKKHTRKYNKIFKDPFKNVLYRLRRQHMLTQPELSSLTGIKQTVICELETGKCPFTKENIEKLHKWVGTDLACVICGHTSPCPFHHLTAAEWEELDKYIQSQPQVVRRTYVRRKLTPQAEQGKAHKPRKGKPTLEDNPSEKQQLFEIEELEIA